MLTKSQERRLSALEKKYDRAAGPTRTFFKDREDINALVLEGVIDRDHGQHLLDNAKASYASAEAARKAKGAPKRQLTSFGAVMRQSRPTPLRDAGRALVDVSDSIGRLFANLGGIVVFLIVLAIVFS